MPMSHVSGTYQVGDKLLNAVVVISGIMVKAGHTVRCQIWHQCQ